MGYVYRYVGYTYRYTYHRPHPRGTRTPRIHVPDNYGQVNEKCLLNFPSSESVAELDKKQNIRAESIIAHSQSSHSELSFKKISTQIR